MDLTMETIARMAVAAASFSLLAAEASVLIRERAVSRPAPIERDSGPLALVYYVGIGMFVLLGLAMAITNGTTLHSLAEPLGARIRAIGILVLWAAGLLAIWGVKTMDRHLVSEAEVRPDTELVTRGPFGIVRTGWPLPEARVRR